MTMGEAASAWPAKDKAAVKPRATQSLDEDSVIRNALFLQRIARLVATLVLEIERMARQGHAFVLFPQNSRENQQPAHGPSSMESRFVLVYAAGLARRVAAVPYPKCSPRRVQFRAPAARARRTIKVPSRHCG
jgi:hypothetical protein